MCNLQLWQIKLYHPLHARFHEAYSLFAMAVSYTSKMFVKSIPGFQAVVEEVLGIVVEPQPEANIIKLFTAVS